MDDEPPAAHVPTGHWYTGEPAPPGQKLPKLQATHAEPLWKKPGLHCATPIIDTPPAAMDQVVAPAERPSSTHRLGAASNKVPAYAKECTAVDVVSAASASACVRAPQPLRAAVTVRPAGQDAKYARNVAPPTTADAATVVITLA